MPHTPTNSGRAPWRATVLTLFPEMFPGPLDVSLSGQALEAGIWSLATIAIRDFGLGKHRAVDAAPAGAIDRARADDAEAPLVYLSPRGTPFDQALARELAAGPGVMLLAGRFEGIDERVTAARNMREVSIGDYVLSGGELAAMVVLDACVRLLPGVVGAAASLSQESFEDGLLEYPQFTKPREWEGRAIPDILLSGDHKRVEEWRRREAERLTAERRPDLARGKRGRGPAGAD